MADSDHPVLAHAASIRAAMLKRDARLLNDLVREYARAYRMLAEDIKRLQDTIGELKPTRAQLYNLAALQNLQSGVRAEMQKFAEILAKKIQEANLIEIQMANADTLAMVQSSLPGMDPARLIATWTRLVPEQVYMQFGFTDPQGPLYNSIRSKFSKAVADLAREALLEGYIMGMNPREIARIMAKVQGISLNWALSTARTANLWSYRAAAHLNYRSNSHVVKGWMWFAQLDDRVCLSCISQHGKEFPLSETLADHHLGRCTPIPLTLSYAELGIEGIDEIPLAVPRGETWFNGLSAGRQRSIMGPSMYKAWIEKQFTFDQLPKLYIDPVYGRMWREASLKDLLGDKAKLYYGSK